MFNLNEAVCYFQQGIEEKNIAGSIIMIIVVKIPLGYQGETG